MKNLSVLSLLFLSLNTFGNENLDSLQVKGLLPLKKPHPSAVSLVGWSPKGDNLKNQNSDCNTEKLKKLIARSGQTSSLGDELRSHFKKCESVYTDGNKTDFGALIQEATINYNAEANPQIRQFTFASTKGTRRTVLVGLKADNIKRPLVIAQCGVLCGVTDPMAHSLTMQLFEESPFNMILLGNSTSLDYVTQNEKLRIGGFEDSQEVMELVQNIQASDSSLRPLIDSIHFVGQSLAGHTAFFVSVRNSALKNPVFSSVQAICPVADLKSSFLNISESSGLMGMINSGEFMHTLNQAAKVNPIVHYLMRRSDLDFSGKINFLTRNYYRNADTETLSNKSEDEFWASLNILNHVGKITTPTLVVNSKNDGIVKHKDNTQALAMVSKENSNLGFLSLETGSHCGHFISVGWPIVTQMMNQFIIKHSGEFKASLRKTEVMGQQIDNSTGQRTAVKSVTWSIKKGSNVLKAQIGFKNNICGSDENNCQNYNEYRLSLKDLGLFDTPENEEMASRISRWANSNLTLVDQNNIGVVESNQPAVKAVFTK